MVYCPACRKVVNTLCTVTEQKEERGDKTIVVMWASYQCESCHRTIHSEKTERAAEESASAE